MGSQARKSRKAVVTQDVEFAGTETRPLKQAIGAELRVLGLSVYEVQYFLHSGDLTNAEAALGEIYQRLRDVFCPSDPASCQWVREENRGHACELLRHEEIPYLYSISRMAVTESDALPIERSLRMEAEDCNPCDCSAQSSSTSNVWDDFVEQVMRF